MRIRWIRSGDPCCMDHGLIRGPIDRRVRLCGRLGKHEGTGGAPHLRRRGNGPRVGHPHPHPVPIQAHRRRWCEPYGGPGAILGHQGSAGGLIRVVTATKALRSEVMREQMDAGRTIGCVSAEPLVLMGAPPRGSRGVRRRRAGCPLHCGRVHLHPKRGRSSPQSARLCAGGLEDAAAG